MSERTREEWLHLAIEALRPSFEALAFPIPAKVHVSVGFGYGAKRESAIVLGQCWSKSSSEDGVNHIFISPEIKSAVQVLETLVHELVHAADDNRSGHRGDFARIAKALGLTGRMTATYAGTALAEKLAALIKEIGPYPHAALKPLGYVRVTEPDRGIEIADQDDEEAPQTAPEAAPEETPEVPEEEAPKHSGPKKQGTRMVKVTCSTDCECGGYTVRTTQKWIAVGMPICPAGQVMELA
ncbi:hypothetical protein ACWDTQ_28285 [Streptomyces cellulosae]